MDEIAPHLVGMLLVGHGTREPRGIAEFHQAAAMIAELLPEVTVAPAFLELATPTVADAAATLARQGVHDVLVVPLLLFAAGHVKEDIPREIGQAATSWPQLSFHFADALGCHEKILKASVERYRQACGADTCPAPNETCLILVGRGSSDAEAIDHMHRLAALRRVQTPVAQLLTAFLAVERPSLPEALKQAAASPCPSIVLQPHLLFHGQLLETLRSEIAAARVKWPGKEWLLVEHLGPCPLVAEAAVERFRQAWDARG